jgi:hypothetical protein
MHDACLCRIQFVNTEWSVLIEVRLSSSLLSHSIGHEKRLILVFVTTNPVLKKG